MKVWATNLWKDSSQLCVIKNIASLYNFSEGSYTEFMEENVKVSSKSVDNGRWNTQENYLWKS